MRKAGLLLLILLISLNLQSQELRCNVQVVSQQIQGSNKQVFQTLQNAIYEFMNNRVWTNHIYTMEERIECNMMFNITEQLSADDIRFRYVEFSPLEFNLNSHISNLTSILAFYAYFVLGIDYDTFSLMGGSQYFNNAEQIVLNASNAAESGWKPMDNTSHKNRYWLIKDMIDTDYEGVRIFNYNYHRLGLDVMDEQVVEGRAEITNSLELLQQVYRKKPDPYMYLLRLVFDAKVDEIVNVFTESYPEERNRAYDILSEVDKPNANKYKAILESTQ